MTERPNGDDDQSNAALRFTTVIPPIAEILNQTNHDEVNDEDELDEEGDSCCQETTFECTEGKANNSAENQMQLCEFLMQTSLIEIDDHGDFIRK